MPNTLISLAGNVLVVAVGATIYQRTAHVDLREKVHSATENELARSLTDGVLSMGEYVCDKAGDIVRRVTNQPPVDHTGTPAHMHVETPEPTSPSSQGEQLD
ncbi:hypothetical protein KIPB_006535 [Kipferlia bialata]|uniref:Uncharacterized protein n=1 Tax=Kipferlia bialata TaxID=797122 RepID=A0A9K3CXP4_9EUKA|nr:hypothetical protein KIPB_006535 [Kipferlia bialata]|eukprot:g6535.t1